jgi:membrane AbrB-like protein
VTDQSSVVSRFGLLLSRSDPPSHWAEQALQLAVAAACGAFLHWLGLPAAWVSGGMIGVALMGLFGRARAFSPTITDFAMILAGTAMGAGASPESLALIARYPGSILLLGLAIVAITVCSGFVLLRRPGWTREEALLASVPGALSTVMLISAQRDLRIGPIAVVQFFRVLVLVALLPSLIYWGAPPPAAVAPPTQTLIPPVPLAVILLLGLALALLLRRIGLAAPFLLGPMLVSVGAHVAGLVHGTLPEPFLIFAFVFIGAYSGSRMRDIDRKLLMRTLVDALMSSLVGLTVAAFFALALLLTLGISFDVGMLAYAPGGLEAMIVLSLVMGLDPLFVGTHHLVRFIGIGMALPVIFRRSASS